MEYSIIAFTPRSPQIQNREAQLAEAVEYTNCISAEG